MVRRGLPYFKQGLLPEQRPQETRPQDRPEDAAAATATAPPMGATPSLPLDIASIPGVLEACWTPDQMPQSR